MAACTQIGCQFESAGTIEIEALDNHLAVAHGIGAARAAQHLGCPFKACDFETSGSAKITAEQMRQHLFESHGVDPKNPQLPVRRYQ